MCDQCDEVVAEVRAIRQAISAEFEHDIGKLIAHLQERERQHADRLLTPLQIIALRAGMKELPAASREGSDQS